ncbi:nickel-dependent hydrogenase large subunit [Allochromatium humboldtianum]|uniref:Uptake hydrogenase large subunit n=1 Tax=Allochromatium humboldtianum TaxID=504901 RepID=A0A850R8J2_9GAMM|nr:nickel-dependent hydrogenase large subunit [Allochromatium humboldtianum]NVZ11009.1 nickel-dependent hydrogenase large subunit [Allochromatium humboldtianum]
MSERIVVDPITRIEGHLRIEAQMDGANIAQAYSSGTMVRGIETILKGRDPRDAWAFVQRICGVCTLVHGIASVRAVEDALRIELPLNAQLIRNLMIGAQYIHDHVMHFYHLHALDWVDVVSALSADPRATSELAQSISAWPKSSPGYFADTQKRIKTFVESGQLGIFANGYWGHPAYRLPPEANLMAVAHYLEALAWQRDTAKFHAIFGGKNPHPNFVVGGVPSPIDLDSDSALNAKRLAEVRNLIQSMRTFVDQVYVPDTLAIAGFYKDWGERGEGLGNFLCYGDLPTGASLDPATFLFPRGVILDRDLSTIHEVDLEATGEIQEFVNHSWYEYSVGNDRGLHPYEGQTNLEYDRRGGVAPPYKQLDVSDGYSWLKAPRWKGRSVEVGPLARVLMLYATGHDQARELVDSTLSRLELPVDVLYSTLGRTAARTLESKILVDAMQGWYDGLIANVKAGDTRTFNETLWEPSSWPSRAQGVGIMEAPRGALGHWIVIEDGRIANYQAVVPSTWNAGPRDGRGQAGAYEAALQDNHQLVDVKQPIEILRTIHSFDPCIACAVHLADPESGESFQVRVV